MEPVHKKRRISRSGSTYADLQEQRARNDLRLKSTFESIFEKYGKDFTAIGDEIDLETGEIVVDHGHLSTMRSENDPGREEDLYDELNLDDAPLKSSSLNHESSVKRKPMGSIYNSTIADVKASSKIIHESSDLRDDIDILGDVDSKVFPGATNKLGTGNLEHRHENRKFDKKSIAKVAQYSRLSAQKQSRPSTGTSRWRLDSEDECVTDPAWRVPPFLNEDSPSAAMNVHRALQERSISPPGPSLWAYAPSSTSSKSSRHSKANKKLLHQSKSFINSQSSKAENKCGVERITKREMHGVDAFTVERNKSARISRGIDKIEGQLINPARSKSLELRPLAKGINRVEKKSISSSQAKKPELSIRSKKDVMNNQDHAMLATPLRAGQKMVSTLNSAVDIVHQLVGHRPMKMRTLSEKPVSKPSSPQARKKSFPSSFAPLKVSKSNFDDTQKQANTTLLGSSTANPIRIPSTASPEPSSDIVSKHHQTPATSHSKISDVNKACDNCFVRTAPQWVDTRSGYRFCIACYTYRQTHGFDRPKITATKRVTGHGEDYSTSQKLELQTDCTLPVVSYPMNTISHNPQTKKSTESIPTGPQIPDIKKTQVNAKPTARRILLVIPPPPPPSKTQFHSPQSTIMNPNSKQLSKPFTPQHSGQTPNNTGGGQPRTAKSAAPDSVRKAVKGALTDPVKMTIKEAVPDPVTKPVKSALTDPVTKTAQTAVTDPAKKTPKGAITDPIKETAKGPTKASDKGSAKRAVKTPTNLTQDDLSDDELSMPVKTVTLAKIPVSGSISHRRRTAHI